MKARQRGHCVGCEQPIRVGQEITKGPGGSWVHQPCGEAMKNAVRVRDGLTFAGTTTPYRRKVKRD